MIIPPTLRQGDCIGIFAPSGPIRDQAKVESGIRVLHGMGFRTKQLPCQDADCDYLAADDQTRADMFHALLADDDVSALMALRGGYGCLRIMGVIDFDLIESYPKFIIGFSDLSILLNAINSRAGILTIHGPVLTSLDHTDNESCQSLFSLLTEGLPQYFPADDIAVLHPGIAEGVLRGGNLATLVHLLGTPWEIPWNGTVLLLEDTAETMYRVDRMLTQLYLSGKLQQLAGIILGSFDTGDNSDSNRLLEEKVWQRTLELTEKMDYPVWANFPVGHLEKNNALPLGADVIMDSSSTRLLIKTM